MQKHYYYFKENLPTSSIVETSKCCKELFQIFQILLEFFHESVMT